MRRGPAVELDRRRLRSMMAAAASLAASMTITNPLAGGILEGTSPPASEFLAIGGNQKVPPGATVNEYWVSKGSLASDSNTGDRYAPFLTVTHAIAVAEAAAQPYIIHIMYGSWDLTSLDARSNVMTVTQGNSTIEGLGDGLTILNYKYTGTACWWFLLFTAANCKLRNLRINIGDNTNAYTAPYWVTGCAAPTQLLDASMNGLMLPQATINVAPGITPSTGTTIQVQSSGGAQKVTYAAFSPGTGPGGCDQYTGCSGGSGTLATGSLTTPAGLVTPPISAENGRMEGVTIQYLTGITAPTVPSAVSTMPAGAFAMGPNGPGASNADIADWPAIQCKVSAPFPVIHGFAAFVHGNGTTGNVSGNGMRDCQALNVDYGVYSGGGAFKWDNIAGGLHLMSTCDFFLEQYCGELIEIRDGRGETGNTVLSSGFIGSVQVKMTGGSYSSYTPTSSNRIILFQQGHLMLDGLTLIGATGVSTNIAVNTSHGSRTVGLTIANCRGDNSAYLPAVPSVDYAPAYFGNQWLANGQWSRVQVGAVLALATILDTTLGGSAPALAAAGPFPRIPATAGKPTGTPAMAAVAVTGVTVANPAKITTGTDHGFVTGQTVTIQGVGGATAVNGNFVVTVVDALNFTVAVNNTNAYTSGGTVGYAEGGGFAPIVYDKTNQKLAVWDPGTLTWLETGVLT